METCYISVHKYDTHQAKSPATTYCERKGLCSMGLHSDKHDRSNHGSAENNGKAPTISIGQGFTLCPVVSVHGTEMQENPFVFLSF